MARRKKQDAGDTGSWLNTYADMVTLLLTFFILLFSMSSLNSARYNLLVRAFAANSTETSELIVLDGDQEGEAMGGLPPELDPNLEAIEDLTDVYEILRDYIEEHQLTDQVEVAKGDDYVFIRFMDDMLFQPNSATLRQEHMELLNYVGYGIKSVQDQAEIIRIDGHTAAIPENPDYAVSDRDLSSRRANAVLMHFEDEVGIDSAKLVQIGFGKQRPFADNDTEEGRRQNRRVEIFISSDDLIGAELDAVYEKLLE